MHGDGCFECYYAAPVPDSECYIFARKAGSKWRAPTIRSRNRPTACMDLLLALAVFCAVTLFTPGPNNLMLLTSGLNFGFRRGLPHLWGVVIGFTMMVLIVGVGLGAVFR